MLPFYNRYSFSFISAFISFSNRARFIVLASGASINETGEADAKTNKNDRLLLEFILKKQLFENFKTRFRLKALHTALDANINNIEYEKNDLLLNLEVFRRHMDRIPKKISNVNDYFIHPTLILYFIYWHQHELFYPPFNMYDNDIYGAQYI